MTTLTIRNIDPVLKEELRVRAARHGRSMEAELRVTVTVYFRVTELRQQFTLVTP